MSKEILVPSDTIVIEDNTSKLTVCTYEDGLETSELTFFDNPNRPGEVMLRGLVVSDPENGVTEHPDTMRYPYTQRVAKLALAQFAETGSLDLLVALRG